MLTLPKEKEKGFILTSSAMLIFGGITVGAAALHWLAPAVLDVAAKTGLFVIMLAMAIPGILAGFFFGLVVNIATWIMGLSMSIPIISGWAYDVGWTFTRDLVNNLFIIILAFIGLATILRIREYEISKLLPKLVIVALLINFSPIIVGFVVDIFNILTNFFLASTSFGETLLGPQNFLMGQLGEGIKGIFGAVGIPAQAGLVFGVLISTVYFVIGSLAFLLIALLYLFRTLAFWILLILAPLAFAAYILPTTKKWWDMWWSQLFQWGMVGLTTAFFLYLSSHLLAGAEQIFQTKQFVEGVSATERSLPTGFADILTVIMPFGIALIFMIVGIILGLQTGAMGGKQIINLGKKAGAVGGLAAGSAAMRSGWLGQGAQKFAENLKKRGQGQEVKDDDKTRLERMPGVGNLLNRMTKPSDREALERQLRGLRAKESRRDELLEQEGYRSPKEENELERLDEEINEGPTAKQLVKEIEATPKTQGIGVGKRIARFGARTIGGGAELGLGELTMRMKVKDEREIKEGDQEGSGKDSMDNATKINQELVKGEFANWNRIIGLLGAMVKNGDTNDLQRYLRDGVLNPEKIGQVLLKAQRGGPPAYRPIAKALYGRLLADPEQLGKEFKVKKIRGEIQRNEDGTPIFENARVQNIANEISEKLTTGEITAKILGDTIDKGKSGGIEFDEFGGKLVLKQLVQVRGGDLTSGLIRRPESKRGRKAILDAFRENTPEDLHKWGADGLIKYLASSAAQGAGVSSPLDLTETNKLIKLLREKDRAEANNEIFGDAEKLKDLVNIWTGDSSPSGAMPKKLSPEEIKQESNQLGKRKQKLEGLLDQAYREAPTKALDPTRLKELSEWRKELEQIIAREKELKELDIAEPGEKEKAFNEGVERRRRKVGIEAQRKEDQERTSRERVRRRPSPPTDDKPNTRPPTGTTPPPKPRQPTPPITPKNIISDIRKGARYVGGKVTSYPEKRKVAKEERRAIQQDIQRIKDDIEEKRNSLQRFENLPKGINSYLRAREDQKFKEWVDREFGEITDIAKQFLDFSEWGEKAKKEIQPLREDIARLEKEQSDVEQQLSPRTKGKKK